MSKELTDDFKLFGDTLVYCRMHVGFHNTGWCTVDTEYKVSLGTRDREVADRKCRHLGLPLFSDKNLSKVKIEA